LLDEGSSFFLFWLPVPATHLSAGARSSQRLLSNHKPKRKTMINSLMLKQMEAALGWLS
jgi:hypothetical protein